MFQICLFGLRIFFSSIIKKHILIFRSKKVFQLLSTEPGQGSKRCCVNCVCIIKCEMGAKFKVMSYALIFDFNDLKKNNISVSVSEVRSSLKLIFGHTNPSYV